MGIDELDRFLTTKQQQQWELTIHKTYIGAIGVRTIRGSNSIFTT